MGKGHVYQQQYYGGNGDAMWMESQAHQTYAFHEEYKTPDQYTNHHMHMKPPSFTMENHAYAHAGHSNGMVAKHPGSGYHHAYGGAGGGKFSSGGGNKFSNHHYGGYSEEAEYEEYECYSEDHEMRFQQHGHGGDHHGFYGNPYEAQARMNRNLSYNNKPNNHAGHKYEWTSKGV